MGQPVEMEASSPRGCRCLNDQTGSVGVGLTSSNHYPQPLEPVESAAAEVVAAPVSRTIENLKG